MRKAAVGTVDDAVVECTVAHLGIVEGNIGPEQGVGAEGSNTAAVADFADEMVDAVLEAGIEVEPGTAGAVGIVETETAADSKELAAVELLRERPSRQP